jgi:serine/threonine-protein kinase
MDGKDKEGKGKAGEGRPSKELESFWCPHCKKLHPKFMTRCPETGDHIDLVYKMAGTVLEGKYKVGKMTGEGGMGVVYSGSHLKIGRKLAIKFLRKSTTASMQVIERFQNEARIAASVGHRNIVDILDMGATRDEIPYIVMEYLEGNDLGDILDTAVRLPQPLAVDFAIQILSALRAVHEQGIIHRDLKPENAFIVNEAGGGVTLKIVDFGVSRLGRGVGEPLSTTRTGAVFGTPRYMAPEQARGSKAIDRRADLYAVGVILYQMLSGALPFEAEDYNNMIIAITTEEPIHVLKHGVSFSEDLARVVMKAIARDPADRFATADELIDALAPHRGKEADLDPSISGSIPAIPGWSMVKGGTPSVRVAETTGSDLSGSGPHDVPTLGPDSGVSHPSMDTGGAWSSTGGRTHPSVPPADAARRAWPAWLLVVVVLLVLAVVGGVATYIYKKTRSIEERMTELATQPKEPEAVAPEPEPAPEPVLWKVEIVGLPEGAEVYVDGTLHPEMPLLVAEADGPRDLRILASGYEPWKKQVAVHADLAMTVQMTELPEPEEEPGKKPGKKPGKRPGKKGEEDEKPGTKKKIDTVYPGLTGS